MTVVALGLTMKPACFLPTTVALEPGVCTGLLTPPVPELFCWLLLLLLLLLLL